MFDPIIKEYATPGQLAKIEALEETGSVVEAARKLGVHHSAVQNAIKRASARAARQGAIEVNLGNERVPDGYKLRGTSTLYNRMGEPILQWFKTAEDRERWEEIVKEAVAAFVEELPRYDPTPAPEAVAEKLMTLYPVGDHHMGMLSWGEETGEDYDVGIGERMLAAAVDRLALSAGATHTGVLLLLGDFLHMDSYSNLTPKNRNELDVDSRYPNVVRAVIRLIRFCIETLKRFHANVRVIVEPGNHDPSSSIFLAEALAAVYENEARVTIDTNPSKFHYFKFGKVLIGSHHGDTVSMERLPAVMATDQAAAWGETQFRYWFTGHTHKDQVQDHPGCRVERVRILPPVDAWAHQQGYRPGRDMKAIVFDADFGEIERYTVNPARLRSEG